MLMNPLNDFVFKTLMKEPALITSFLEAILDPTDAPLLTGLTITDDAALTRELIRDKTGRLDLKVTTPGGMTIDLEVQRANQYNMTQRTLFYWTRLFTENLQQGDEYRSLTRTITINLLDFSLLSSSRIHHCFHLTEDTSPQIRLTDLLEIHFIQLPAFRSHQTLTLQTNPLHRWLVFLDLTQPITIRKEVIALDTTIAKAQQHLERLSSDQETQALYRAREDSLRDLNNLIKGAKREGMEKGREEGQLEILHRQITKKFGPLSPELNQQIDQLTSQKLDDLAEQLLDFQTISDLTQWLKNQKAVER